LRVDAELDKILMDVGREVDGWEGDAIDDEVD